LGAALLAAVVAVTVPLVTFRMTLRLEKLKWVRDQRAKLYAELIANAIAECEPYRNAQAAPERIHQLTLQPRERAELGARAMMFASDRVRQAWMRIAAYTEAHPPPQTLTDEEQHHAQQLLHDRFTALLDAVRDEISAPEPRLPG
jgi:hypothetical protein